MRRGATGWAGDAAVRGEHRLYVVDAGNGHVGVLDEDRYRGRTQRRADRLELGFEQRGVAGVRGHRSEDNDAEDGILRARCRPMRHRRGMVAATTPESVP